MPCPGQISARKQSRLPSQCVVRRVNRFILVRSSSSLPYVYRSGKICSRCVTSGEDVDRHKWGRILSIRHSRWRSYTMGWCFEYSGWCNNWSVLDEQDGLQQGEFYRLRWPRKPMARCLRGFRQIGSGYSWRSCRNRRCCRPDSWR